MSFSLSRGEEAERNLLDGAATVTARWRSVLAERDGTSEHVRIAEPVVRLRRTEKTVVLDDQDAWGHGYGTWNGLVWAVSARHGWNPTSD